jgi:hypothetical protein
MSSHQHLTHEADDTPLECPEAGCWWNDPEAHKPDPSASHEPAEPEGLIAGWYAALGFTDPAAEWDETAQMYREPEMEPSW